MHVPRFRRPQALRSRVALAVLPLLALSAPAVGTSTAHAAGPPLTPSAIGEDPATPGVFRFPQGVGIDQRNGNVFVADQYSGVVQAFGSNGERRFSFGGRAERGEAGRLGVVGGVALDRSGHVFVLDSENNRIQVFSADDGRYLSTFAQDAGLALSNTSSRPDGGISAGGIAVSQRRPGDQVVVFVADAGNDRVLRYGLEPNSLRPYGPPRSTADAGINLKRPQGVSVDGAGTRLFIPDNQNHRVLVVHASTFKTIGEAGSFGKGLGQFQFPYDTALDARNQLYVGDNINGRVNVYDGASLDLLGTFGGTGYRVGRFSIVRAVATNHSDPAGGVWVADTANNRIQRMSAEGRVTSAWGVAGRSAGFYSRPRGVAFRPDGGIEVADTFAHRVSVTDPDGTVAGVFGRISKLNNFAAPGSDTSNQLLVPSGVAYDTQGGSWVADTFNNRLVRFDNAGNVAAATADGALSRPRGVAAAPDGTVFATDSGGRLVRVSPDGAMATVRTGLNRPAAVAVTPQGTAIVASARIVLDDATGKRISPPDAQYWDAPQGLAVAPDGTLYVAEARPKTPGGARIVRGTPQAEGGYAWETIAGEGTGLGQVIDPANLALSPDGTTLLVADAGNNRVQRFDAPGVGPAPRHRLTVALGGGPTLGTVSSAPGGIDCGTDCTQLLGVGRAVTLTAKPHPDAQFTGWGGDCAPAGANPTCQIAASRDLNVSATFAPVPPPPVKLSSLTLSTTRWHLPRKAVRKAKGRKARKAQPSTTAEMVVRLTQDARVRLYVEESRVGKTVGKGATKRCARVARPARLKKKQRCSRWALLPTRRNLRLVAGTTTVDVKPRFPGRTLKPGLYRLRATATDPQGNVSTRTSRRIRITR
ncbi:NHL repeat-containing protein [Patulibacter americanus]|uniref:NHL repeat-containing protein n=1 Tax=Patulibacter americanus TaxID=588672 RepID=UPI0003B33287|nr:NHL repeat-containing protein [Patulibacter americanus]